MARHIIQGFKIMHEYHARPTLDATNMLVLAHRGQLPMIDTFIIKLFAAPCKFTEPPATADTSAKTASAFSLGERRVESCDARTIATDRRTELTKIAASTLGFLDKVSHVDSTESALRLLSEKASLLHSLERWLTDAERDHTKAGPSALEPLSVSFMRLFYQLLTCVLVGTLSCSPRVCAGLEIEYIQLQSVAYTVGEGIKVYTR